MALKLKKLLKCAFHYLTTSASSWRRRIRGHESNPLSQLKAPAEAISIFHKLPTELILHIAGFLPEASVASFTLCNRMIMRSLGTKHLEKPKDQREEFLLLLERDLPNHVFCYQCKILHCPWVPDTPGRIYPPKLLPCERADHNIEQYRYFLRHFDFVQLQLAMKRHRLGLDPTPYLGILKATRTFKNKNACHYQWSTEPRIINDELYVRSQHWHLMPKTPHTSKELNSFFFWGLNDHHLCPHYDSDDSFRTLELITPIHCKLNHWHSANPTEAACCPTCSTITRCLHCPMEFQVDMQEFDSKRIAIVVTSWRSYGRCQSPLDQKWKSYYIRHPRCAEYLESLHNCDDCEYFRYKGVAGDLKAEYEQGKEFHFDILTPKNRKILAKASRAVVSCRHYGCNLNRKRILV